ncbi:MAG: cytochrome c oxidase subunit II [Alphaproteobacteria bacterium]|nr:cytochrome c oxidase subunit II [Alphaproteobacteria bacterium]
MSGKCSTGWSVAAGLALTVLWAGLAPSVGLAESAHDWQMWMQPAASPVAERFHEFHHFLLILITCISVFVLALLLYVIVRFRASANPTPSQTTHNTLIEVLWTVVPVLILVVMAVPSFKLLYYVDRTHDAELNIKVTAHQWFWSYEYPDNGNFQFDANHIADADLKPDQLRLLSTDNHLVLPIDTNVRVLITSTDVMHSWFIPPVGVQMYATPGRTNETWVRIEREGTFYGQCNQICGINHGYMPIEIEAVSKDKFKQWVAQAQKKFARIDAEPPVQVAVQASVSGAAQ